MCMLVEYSCRALWCSWIHFSHNLRILLLWRHQWSENSSAAPSQHQSTTWFRKSWWLQNVTRPTNILCSLRELLLLSPFGDPNRMGLKDRYFKEQLSRLKPLNATYLPEFVAHFLKDRAVTKFLSWTCFLDKLVVSKRLFLLHVDSWSSLCFRSCQQEVFIVNFNVSSMQNFLSLFWRPCSAPIFRETGKSFFM